MAILDWQHTPLVDFERMTLPDKPHYCTVEASCSQPRCIKAPVFKLSLSQLKQRWQAMVDQQPRVKLLRHDDKHWQYQYVQRSLIFRFPDLIDVRFYQINADQSSLQAYSRSVYGYSDLGVNCKRLKHWLASLQHEH